MRATCNVFTMRVGLLARVNFESVPALAFSAPRPQKRNQASAGAEFVLWVCALSALALESSLEFESSVQASCYCFETASSR